MARNLLISLSTSDYVSLATTPKTLTTTTQRQQIMLSLLILALDRDTWESMPDSVWDAWSAGLSEMVEELSS